MLNPTGGCYSLSYDVLTVHVAIVLMQYMLLAMEQCQNEDQRILGLLGSCSSFLLIELQPLFFSRSLGILAET